MTCGSLKDMERGPVPVIKKKLLAFVCSVCGAKISLDKYNFERRVKPLACGPCSRARSGFNGAPKR